MGQITQVNYPILGGAHDGDSLGGAFRVQILSSTLSTGDLGSLVLSDPVFQFLNDAA
jgi:hypothetical protein